MPSFVYVPFVFVFGWLNYSRESRVKKRVKKNTTGVLYMASVKIGTLVKTSTLDELRRVLLPSSLIKPMGWSAGTRVTALLVEKKQSIMLIEQENGELQIDDLSRVTLHAEHCCALKWGAKDAINVMTTYGNTTSVLLTRLG